MKKAAILFLAVLVLLIGTVSVLGASVHSACDQVVFTEQAVYGDPQEAKGLTVGYRTTYDNKLLWDTTYAVGGAADLTVQIKGGTDGGAESDGDDKDQGATSLEHTIDTDVDDTKTEGKENGVGHPLGKSFFEKTTDQTAKQDGDGIDENT